MKAPGKLLLSKLFRNCAEPRGALGRLMLRMMNRGHRRVYNWTFDHCPLADGMRTLDVGCGGGGAILELTRRFPAIRADGVDVSEESVAMCRRRVAEADIANPGEIVRSKADALPMADATYDLAYAIETAARLRPDGPRRARRRAPRGRRGRGVPRRLDSSARTRRIRDCAASLARTSTTSTTTNMAFRKKAAEMSSAAVP